MLHEIFIKIVLFLFIYYFLFFLFCITLFFIVVGALTYPLNKFLNVQYMIGNYVYNCVQQIAWLATYVP